MARMKRIEVKWEDAWLDNHGWEPIASIGKPGARIICRSIGFVLSETKRGIVLAGNVNGPNAAGVAFIPKSQIRKRRRIR